MSFLVLDIETIPDPNIWQPPVEEVEIPRLKVKDAPTKGDMKFLALALEAVANKKPIHPSDIEKAQEIAEFANDETANGILKPLVPLPEKKDPIAPIPAHRPIVIGCLFLDKDLNTKKIGVVGTGELHGNEHQLLSEWADFMAREKPAIIDWNGRSFDMPVLTMRCFRHGIPLRWYYSERNYRYRYSDEMHVDLMDVMTDYGAANRMGFKLDAVAKSIGLPGKYGVDGSMVNEMYKAGKISEIETYCMTDVIQTGFVFLRWFFLKGRVELDAYREKSAQLLQTCRNDERFKEFCSLIDENTLLLKGT